MNTKLAAFIIAILVVIAITVTIRTFRKNRLSTRLFLMWLFIWMAIGFLTLFPSMLNRVMEFVNMHNWMFFLTTGAILILFIIMFYLSSGISEMSRRISKLVREVAILNYKLNENKKNNNPKNEA